MKAKQILAHCLFLYGLQLRIMLTFLNDGKKSEEA